MMMLINSVVLLSMLIVLWRADRAINASRSTTPVFIRMALVMVYVGSCSVIYLSFASNLTWPFALLSLGAALFLLIDRRRSAPFKHKIHELTTIGKEHGTSS